MRTFRERTIWLKIASIALAGTFALQANAFALKYGDYADDVLPDYDWAAGATGFAVTVAMPFVPGAAAGLGSALGLGATGTVMLGTTMGAGLGATPGLVSGDDTSAWIGGAGGGLGGYFGTSNYISNANLANSTSISNMNWELGNIGATEAMDASMYLSDASYFASIGDNAAAAANLGYANEILSGVNIAEISTAQTVQLTQLSANLASAGSILSVPGAGIAINPSFPMRQYVSNLAINIASQEAGTTLARLGALSWGMSPEGSQFLGMLGGSTAGWTLGAATPQGQAQMENMYRKINPGLADMVTGGNANTWTRLTAGAITGLGLGSLQAGINMGLDSALEKAMDDRVSDSLRLNLASMGGEFLGSLAWGGVVGAFGEDGVRNRRLNNLADSGDPIGFPTIHVEPGTGSVTYKDYNGFWAGVEQVANEQFGGQFYNYLIQRGAAVGISLLADEWGVKPQYVDTFGTTGAILLANLPIWPHIINAGAADNLGQLRFDNLRVTAPITDNETLDMFLEPAIYGLSSIATLNLSKDKDGEYKTGSDLVVHNWGAMQGIDLAQSGIATLINGEGWDEFVQGYNFKMREFYGDLLSFGTRAFGAATSGRTEDMIGASNITGAAQRNSRIWDFVGVSGLSTSADRIHELGGDWRLYMGVNMPHTFVEAMSQNIGNLARYHSIRNMEASAYMLARPIFPYDENRLSPAISGTFDPETLKEIRRWIRESPYPAYYDPGIGIRFPGWRIGFDPEDRTRQILVNEITEAKYPLTSEVLRELKVTRPFEDGPFLSISEDK